MFFDIDLKIVIFSSQQQGEQMPPPCPRGDIATASAIKGSRGEPSFLDW